MCLSLVGSLLIGSEGGLSVAGASLIISLLFLCLAAATATTKHDNHNNNNVL
jgi:hypothetical protein